MRDNDLMEEAGAIVAAEGYSAGRIKLFDALVKKRPDIANARFWVLEPKKLRFRLGESLAELKVPYHMGADDEALIDGAITGLATLLARRYSPDIAQGRADKVTAQILTMQGTPLKEKTFRTDLFIVGSFEKRLASLILSSTPYIDSAILSSWLAPEGVGRGFAKWVMNLFEKTLAGEAKYGWEERTSYLAYLTTVNTIRKKKEKLKDLRIKGISYERLDLAVGLTLFITLKSALKELFAKLIASGAGSYNPLTEALLLSAAVPKAFLSIPTSLLSVSINPYGINKETFDLLSPVAGGITDETKGINDMLNASAEKIRDSSPALEAVRAQYDILRFRQEALRYMMEFDVPGSEVQGVLYEVYNEDRLIKNLLSDSRQGANLVKSLEEIKKAYVKDPRRVEVADSLQRFLASFKKSGLGFLTGGRRDSPESILTVLQGYCGCRIDDHIEGSIGLMREYLKDRREEFTPAILKEEYERGRLYRFSTDDRPVLKTLAREEEGQLFVDMKDFTRKTLKVKELAMAEFMKEYFYKPILSAAKRYGAGVSISEDERGIRLTNIPGDAVIFSGNVEYLVSLAKDIQHIIRRYREQLVKRLPPRKDEEMLEEVHRRFEARKGELKEKRMELNRALENNEDGAEARLITLGEEEHRLENSYRDELEEAVRGELTAGLYISFGAKAEITVLESMEDFSSTIRVAIGEKINEASRGTFRNAMVRAKLEMFLEDERHKRNNKRLNYPFDVYIDRTYSLRMPPEHESAFEKLIITKKQGGAQALAQVLAQEYFSDLKKIIAGEPFSALRLINATTDIYNRGQALSIDALEAYMRETKGAKRFFNKIVNTPELDESIRQEFFFPSDVHEFWFGVGAPKGLDYIDVFYKSGDVIFKGFEAKTPTAVYEMLNPESDFFKALVKCHFQQWLEESKKSGQDDTL